MTAEIEGTVWPWHQDFGTWPLDGIEHPDLVTFMITLDEARNLEASSIISRVVTGKEELNLIGTSPRHNKLWAVPPGQVRKSLEEGNTPISITGKPGDAALFHCNLLHASG